MDLKTEEVVEVDLKPHNGEVVPLPYIWRATLDNGDILVKGDVSSLLGDKPILSPHSDGSPFKGHLRKLELFKSRPGSWPDMVVHLEEGETLLYGNASEKDGVVSPNRAPFRRVGTFLGKILRDGTRQIKWGLPNGKVVDFDATTYTALVAAKIVKG